MEAHPSFSVLEPYLTPAPLYAAAFLLVWNDLVKSQKWHDVKPEMLEAEGLECKGGKRPFMFAWRNPQEGARVILPLMLSENLSPKWLRSHFSAVLHHPSYLTHFSSHAPHLEPAGTRPPPGVEGEQDPPVIYMAMVAKDSSVVYYRLVQGVEKPHDVPE